MNRPETRDEMLAALRSLKPWLEEQRVTDPRLFGSFALSPVRLWETATLGAPELEHLTLTSRNFS